MEKYVGTSEAAKILGYSQAYLTKLCREGKLPDAEQDGRGKPWRIPVCAIEEFKKQKGRTYEKKASNIIF